MSRVAFEGAVAPAWAVRAKVVRAKVVRAKAVRAEVAPAEVVRARAVRAEAVRAAGLEPLGPVETATVVALWVASALHRAAASAAGLVGPKRPRR